MIVSEQLSIAGKQLRAVNGGETDATDQSLLDDAVRTARSFGVQMLSPLEYFQTFWKGHDKVWTLFSSLEAVSAGLAGNTAQDVIYPAHLTDEKVSEEMAEGSVVRGTLSVTSIPRHEALVHLSGTREGAIIKLSGREAMNRSLHGDAVAIRLPWQYSRGLIMPAAAASLQHEDGNEIDVFIQSEGDLGSDSTEGTSNHERL